MEQYEFTDEYVRRMIERTIRNEQTHNQLAEWCCRYVREVEHNDYIEPKPLSEHVAEVVNDIDTQWELYLVNTFDVSELATLDLQTVQMPEEWLVNWYKKC
ncbi:hypothetical protein [Priestia taiwanensis]|uniref:Uncharacterized protein n=1 Tax=Priestia taiwanensis TaxID=1347902 RepID=A0A917ASG3_9BACI|nr:hypothetical protein [Priestia taiwanensis]MBM7363899.1 hypothetical protein [Priestia taiwanensis]GGE69938.1 hypothetical protein GCM10007140_19920 [Priestia taiwanensis]